MSGKNVEMNNRQDRQHQYFQVQERWVVLKPIQSSGREKTPKDMAFHAWGTHHQRQWECSRAPCELWGRDLQPGVLFKALSSPRTHFYMPPQTSKWCLTSMAALEPGVICLDLKSPSELSDTHHFDWETRTRSLPLLLEMFVFRDPTNRELSVSFVHEFSIKTHHQEGKSGYFSPGTGFRYAKWKCHGEVATAM